MELGSMRCRSLSSWNVDSPLSGCSPEEINCVLSVHLDLGALGASPVLVKKDKSSTQKRSATGGSIKSGKSVSMKVAMGFEGKLFLSFFQRLLEGM